MDFLCILYFTILALNVSGVICTHVHEEDHYPTGSSRISNEHETSGEQTAE
jgi:hypothetical protein